MTLSVDITLLVEEIIEKLRTRGQTISTAESITAGGLSAALTSVAGSSEVFVGGVTAYRSEIKSSHLNIDPALISSKTVYSEEIAIEMAKGALQSFGTTWAISTTGVGGPGPSDGVAAGTVWVAIAGPTSQTIELALSGERESVRNATVSSAIGSFARILRAVK